MPGIQRASIVLYATAVLALSHAPSAWAAAPSSEGMSTTQLVIWAVTIVGALVLGVLLYLAGQRSSSVRFREAQDDDTPRRQPQKQTVAHPTSFTPKITEQLRQLKGSPQQIQQVAKSMNEIVSSTVTAQVDSVRKELDHQYGKMVADERKQSAQLQKKYVKSLEDRQQTTAVLESLAEGLVVVNNQGDVIMMNPAAEQMLDVNQHERIGKPLRDSMGDDQLVSMVRDDKSSGRDIVLEAKREETKKILRASNAMITNENGQTVGMVAVLSDVTKQRELDQMKSDFVSKVSHELRTPLVAMQHSMSLIYDEVAGPLTEEQKKFLDISKRNLSRLNGLINDLLDLSKLEAQKMEMHLQPSPLGPVILQVCETLDAWTQSKGIALGKRVPDGLPEAMMDAARITQVLTNLLGNAIKFTPKQGRIMVEVKRANEDGFLEVGVSDTGPGISQDDMKKLFGKFQQVGERPATDMAGTGLGLAISKEIVELHRGRIWVESEMNKGTRMLFTLPVAPVG